MVSKEKLLWILMAVQKQKKKEVNWVKPLASLVQEF